MTLGTLTADGNTASQKHGNKGTLYVSGTFGGGTVKLQVKPEGLAAWVDVASASLTAEGYVDFSLNAETVGLEYRANLAGATSPDVDIYII